jgi:hypothetical protein
LVSLIASALAATVPVAIQDLAPGTPVEASHIRWVELSDAESVDALLKPEGQIVIERVLQGEIFRAERLLDVDKPERIAIPGMRALRVPSPNGSAPTGHRADLWVARDKPCTWAQGAWVLGPGRDVQGNVDSAWILVSPQVALTVLAEGLPLQVRAVTDATAAKARPEIACSP